MRVFAIFWLLLGLLQPHPYDGRWTANLAASRFNGSVPVKALALDVVVDADRVTLTNRVDTGQREIVQGATFVTDGAPHRNDELMPNLTVVAKWVSARVLDTVMTRPDGTIDHVTYEWAEDGRTLTTKTSGPFGTQEVLLQR